MLGTALTTVVENLENTSLIVGALTELGKKHHEYGVTPVMYSYVGKTLLTTLANAAGKDWSPKLEKAWTDAYGVISSVMIAQHK